MYLVHHSEMFVSVEMRQRATDETISHAATRWVTGFPFLMSFTKEMCLRYWNVESYTVDNF